MFEKLVPFILSEIKNYPLDSPLFADFFLMEGNETRRVQKNRDIRLRFTDLYLERCDL